MITLKNGYTTTDPRCDLILLPVPEKDPRNRGYGITIDDRPIKSTEWPVDKYLDQGPIGACVGYGFGHEAIATPVPVIQMDNKKAFDLFIEAQRLDPWPGEYPGYEGTTIQAGAKPL